jgi:hypothetical protein
VLTANRRNCWDFAKFKDKNFKVNSLLPIVEFFITRNFACPQPLPVIALLCGKLYSEKRIGKRNCKRFSSLAYFAEKKLFAKNVQNPFSSISETKLKLFGKLILKIAAEFLWQFKTETKRKNLFLFGCFENSKIFGLKTL